MSVAERHQLKVKTASVKRIRKELLYYEKEVVEEQEKVDKMKDDNEDPHVLRQAENCLAETKAMVPDSKVRLDTAVADLKTLLGTLTDSLKGSEELLAAEEVLSEAEPLVEA
eukprot:evm.model.scf_226EXC.3 EVM.evm.TU.scf_226EXC.3   scf_226EXC:22525-23518(+)